MRIYHNIPALYAYNALSSTNNALQKSIRTLSTGLRINSAADDAAGLAISEKMRSQINGLNMAVRNAQDGISMLQTAEGALSEVHSILQRMRELSVQAANDTLTQQDRQYIQLEIDQLKDEISRTSTATQFNKKRLLDGSSAGLWSSNDLATKAYIRGSLRKIDQFGQKAAFEGNYKIQINAKPGQAEAMKTDIFKIKHKNVVMGVNVNAQPGGVETRWSNNALGPDAKQVMGADSAQSLPVNLMAGTYEVKAALGEDNSDGKPRRLFKNGEGELNLGGTGVSDATHNVVTTFVVKSKTADSITVDWTSMVVAKNGTVTQKVGTSTLSAAATAVDLGTGAAVNIQLSDDIEKYGVGDVLGYNVTAKGAANSSTTEALVTVKSDDLDPPLGEHKFLLTKTALVDKNQELKIAYLDDKNRLQNGSISVFWGKHPEEMMKDTPFTETTLATFRGVKKAGQDALNWDIRVQGNIMASGKDQVDPTLPENKDYTVDTVLAVDGANGAVLAGGGNAPLLRGGTPVGTGKITIDGTDAQGATSNALITFKVEDQVGANVILSWVSRIIKTDGSTETKTGTVSLVNTTNVVQDFGVGAGIQIQVDDVTHFKKGEELVYGITAKQDANAKTNNVNTVLSLPVAGTGLAAPFNVVLESAKIKGKPLTLDIPYLKNGKVEQGRLPLRIANPVSSAVTGIYSTRGAKGNKVLGPALGGVRVDNLPAGSYAVTGRKVQNEAIAETGRYGKVGAMEGKVNYRLDANASVLLEVLSVDASGRSVTFKATSNILRADGTVETRVDDNVMLVESDTEGTDMTSLGFAKGAFSLRLKPGEAANFAAGAKVVYNLSMGKNSDADMTVQIQGTQTREWDNRWGPEGNGVTENPVFFGLRASGVANKDIHFRNFYLNSANGKVYEGDIVLSMKADITPPVEDVALASFEAAYIGQVAKHDVHLRDLDKFWDSQGRFMLTDPQTITISQGDGKNTSVTLYSTDTLDTLKSKLNNAIANDLGQARFAVSEANKFVTFVEQGSTYPGTLESVPGTFIIRSMVAGAAGKLSFAGDEDLIKALSLNVVQEASENAFTASVYDAHNGATIANSVTVSGNQLIGVIHPNVDVEFDPMANIKVTWNETTRAFDLIKKPEPHETILHLVDNSTIFQVGANEGEDVAIDIGNMSSDALGVTRVIVTDRVSAARAISILDNAINKVSMQRAKIGAFQNSLEHTVTNLTATGTNLSAAESRIRDADMSLEMLNFTKLQILSQSGTAMLAQANQLPQTVLSLIRG